MNKKLYPTNWKAVATIINNIKSLQTFQQQPTVNISTATISCIMNIPWTLKSKKDGIGKDVIKWVKTQMKAFEKNLHLEHQIVRNATFVGISNCIYDINLAIKEIEKAI